MKEPLSFPSDIVSEEQRLFTRRLIAREEGAFQQVFEQEKKRCFLIARGMLSHTEEASDTVQEAFLKLWKFSTQLDEKKGYRSWLYRCVINATLDRLRQKKRQAYEVLDLDIASSYEITEDLLQQEQSERLKNMIQKAMLQLDEKYRVVVLLRIWEKMPYKEIAEVLNIPSGTAGRRFTVGLEKLEQILSRDYEQIQ